MSNGIRERIVCESVIGGWQLCRADSGEKFGPVCNDVAELWKWERGYEKRRVLLECMTPEQAATFVAFFVRQSRESSSPKPWGEFFNAAIWDGMSDCVMFGYAGMWMGIERDGYAHS